MNLDAKPEVFVTGFEAPEGPSFRRDGWLFFVDFEAGRVYRAAPDGTVEVVAEGGRPVGTKFHRDGRLFVCDSTRGLITIDSEGSSAVIAEEFEGKRLNGPNDLTISSKGDIYFTDPRGSSLERPIGDVYCYRADARLELLDSGYALCNGIAIGPGEEALYVAETYTKRIYRFGLQPDGSLGARDVFVKLEGGLGPDGMAFDAAGNLYVAHWGKGCIAVFDPEGAMLGELPTIGEKPSNIAFWNDTIYVTEVQEGQVVRIDVGVTGLQVYGLMDEDTRRESTLV